MNWKNLVEKIPSRVQLKKQCEYEVVWVDSFSDSETMGETRFNKKQIAIKKNMSPKNTVVTYLHEILHGISGEHGVELTEAQVTAFENAFYYLLKENNIFKGKK